MAEINWTKEAETWLKDTHDYIALDKPIAGIYERAQLLANFPEIGSRYWQRTDKHIRMLLYRTGRWRKLKGVALIRLRNGSVRRAEVHWYEAHGIGRKEMKRKRYLD